MFQIDRNGRGHAPIILAAGIALMVLSASSKPMAVPPTDQTSVNVLVTDAETGQPIFQARLTLQFHETGMFKHKLLTYSSKTNAQGRCRFVDIPKGTIRLIVTAERHQTFSKEFEVDKDNPLFEAKLKKPQEQL
jgi:hypothetical protein